MPANEPIGARLRGWLVVFKAEGRNVALRLGLLFSGLAVLVTGSPRFEPWPVVVLWLLGMSLFVMGAAGVRMGGAQQDRLPGEKTSPRLPYWELIVVLLLTAAAFVVRAYRVGEIPYNVHGDEGEMGMAARVILAGTVQDPFSTNWASHPTIWFFIQAMGLQLFGNNLFGLRMTSAIIGALTIPALYLFARPLYGRGIAIASSALLGAYHFHLHISRLGLNNVVDPLMLILTFSAFFMGLRKRSALLLSLSGILAGISNYFYVSSRIIPILLLAFLAYQWIVDRQSLRGLSKAIGLMVSAFVLAIAPLLRYYASHPETFFGPFRSRSLLQPENFAKLPAKGSVAATLASHAYQTVFYLVAIDERGQFYSSGSPLLSHGMEILFVVGLLVAIWQWRKLEHAGLIITVLAIVVLGGFLQWQEQESQRYVIAAPILCILITLGLGELRSLLRTGGRTMRRLSTVATSTILIALIAWNLYFYFDIYTPRNDYANSQALTFVGRYLTPRSGHEFVYYFTAPQLFYEHPAVQFLSDGAANAEIADRLTDAATLPQSPAGLQPIFVFTPERIGELDVVKQRYPLGQLKAFRRTPDTGQTMIYIYEPSN